MSRKVLGIDIRNDFVSAVLVKAGLRENRIEAHAYVPIADSPESENGILEALETLTDQIDLADCDSVVSISADGFVYRNIKIPFKDPKKIQMVLPFELEPTVPYPVEDLVIDFIHLKKEDQGENTALMAVAAQKSLLNSYVNTLAEVKIDPEMLTVSGLPAALCLANQADPGEDQLLLDIGPNHCTLFIVVDRQIKLIRSFPIPADGEARTRSICAHVRSTMEAYDELSPTAFQPLDLAVTGRGLNGLNIGDDIAPKLDLSVKHLNFADQPNISMGIDVSDSWDPSRFDSALSLALMEIEGLKGLNFHKSQFAAKKFLAKHKKPLIKTGILAAVVLVLIIFSVVAEYYTLNKQLNRVDNQIAEVFTSTFPEVKQIRDPFQQMQVKVQEAKKNAGFQSEDRPHIRSIDILNSISAQIPASIVVDISRMVISPENVLISGNTDTFNSVDDIKSKLEQIDFFKKVTINSANIDRSGKEVRFQLKAEM